ncbi:uncharacterized protein LOC102807781, partial [Saccoglossus kowalevskii]|uniref:Uncharacterized protein LOC102807781 n=1 Tax=Saccoglossus kowalevskii TaxID=10224 RepID=A0ABM0LV37_SACKO
MDMSLNCLSPQMYKEEKTLKEFNQNETSDIHTMEPDADGFIPPGPVTGINKQKRTGDEADNIALITPTKTKKGTVSESSVQEYSNYLGANENSSITDVVKEMGQGLKLSCAEWAQLF